MVQEHIIFFGGEKEIVSLKHCLSGFEKETTGYVITDHSDRWRIYRSVDAKDKFVDIIRGFDKKKYQAVVMNSKNMNEVTRFLKNNGLEYEILIFEEWISSIIRNKHIKLHPKKIGIDASTYCQLNCVGCYMRVKNYDGVGKGMLSYENYKKVIDGCNFIKEVGFANNGEALLNPELPKILRYSYERGIETDFGGGVNFNTVSEELMDALVNYHVSNINIAIDGASDKVYSQYRRNGNYEKVLENIRKINHLKKTYGTDKPKLTWQYVLMKDNEKDIEKARQKALELDMKIVWKLDWGGTYVPQNPEWVKRITGLEEFNRNEGNYNWGNRCRELVFYPKINWDGMLLGCCSSHSMSFGINVFETGIERAVNETKYRKTIEDVFGRKQPEKDVPCGNCWIYNDKIITDK